MPHETKYPKYTTPPLNIQSQIKNSVVYFFKYMYLNII